MQLFKKLQAERRRKKWLATKLQAMEDKTLILRMGR